MDVDANGATERAKIRATLEQMRDLRAELRRNIQVHRIARADAAASREASMHLRQRLAYSEARPASALLGTARQFGAVDEIIAQVEQLARRGDPLNALAGDIKMLVTSEMNPGMLMGVLLEGIVQTLLQRMPAQERRGWLVALLQMFCVRLDLPDVDPT